MILWRRYHRRHDLRRPKAGGDRQIGVRQLRAGQPRLRNPLHLPPRPAPLPNLRHQASGGGTVTITSSVAIVNDTTWSTIVGTWRPGRLELYVDGWSRASSTAAATNTSALFGIYRRGWGFLTSQDFNGRHRSSRASARPGPPPWSGAGTPIRSASCVHGTSCLRSWGARHPPRHPRPARDYLPDGAASCRGPAGIIDWIKTVWGRRDPRRGLRDHGHLMEPRPAAPRGLARADERCAAH
jgi:Concanavalin A-like lectin/glucanases superfamily